MKFNVCTLVPSWDNSLFPEEIEKQKLIIKKAFKLDRKISSQNNVCRINNDFSDSNMIIVKSITSDRILFSEPIRWTIAIDDNVTEIFTSSGIILRIFNINSLSKDNKPHVKMVYHTYSFVMEFEESISKEQAWKFFYNSDNMHLKFLLNVYNGIPDIKKSFKITKVGEKIYKCTVIIKI